MATSTAESKVSAPTGPEIEDLKAEIRALFPDYLTRRFELGMKLIQLQKMLAHPGNGTFTEVATIELKIPHSTVYDLIDFAEAEAARLKKLSLSENRTDPDNIDVDLDDPEEVARLLELFKQEAEREKDLEYLHRPPRKPKPYKKDVNLHLIVNRDTRVATVRAWKVLKRYKQVHEKLCYKLAKEVIRAAAKLEKDLD